MFAAHGKNFTLNLNYSSVMFKKTTKNPHENVKSASDEVKGGTSWAASLHDNPFLTLFLSLTLRTECDSFRMLC